MDGEVDIESLFRSFHLDVYHFSLYFSNNKQDAEDITQETFLKAINEIHRLRDPSRAKYWLLSIARNTAFDHLRRKKRKLLLSGLMESLAHQTHNESLDDHMLIKEQW